MAHANARLTFHGRLLIVERARAGWKQAHIASAMGVSRKTVGYWIARFNAEGEAGLRDRSSRPYRSPRRTSAAVEAELVRLREAERLGRDELAARVGVSPRTASRILIRRQMPRLALLDAITGQLIRSSKQTAIRYQRDEPGELVHMDVKKLGRIPDGGGWRAHGRSEKVRGRGIGYDYVHSLVDDRTRLAYSEIHPDEKAATVAQFLERALDYLAACGITKVQRLMTDNALAYRRSAAVRELCARRGITQKFIKPHCPWQNGKVERLNRTLQTEWAYRRPYDSNEARAAALAPWLKHYNTERRHSALGGQPPISLLTPTC
ncbi:IS481 family transposase [Gryllotalpicola protaetiae]|uniref:IS481 family transposase n=1 Tax=Gryllotalpicola protaetiae TaxID=2419771 RepID=A0A387BY48_9MICO|nr:IS481 family transposase [Gryllotalpicola protaetiae]AYG03271.1 IS481 family transposase [Gryllotalpicola protaetiae]